MSQDRGVREPPLDQPLPGLHEPFHRPPAIAPAPRWVAPVFAGLAAFLVPWTVVLALTLPAEQTSSHYRIAWVGFDVMLLVALGLTGWFAAHRSTWVEVAASVSATMLALDAWFDVMTSGDGWGFAEALATALLIELPLAGVSLWIARHAAEVGERTAALLVRRSERQAERLRARADDHPGR